MANKKKSRKLKSRMADLAEELGTFLGTSERKAKGWLSEQERLTKKLTGIRDQASALLSQLGSVVEKNAAKLAAKATGKKAAAEESAPKKGKAKDGKAKDAKGKESKAKDSKPKRAVKARKAPKPAAPRRTEPAIDDVEAPEPL
jgi:hypothetical protein